MYPTAAPALPSPAFQVVLESTLQPVHRTKDSREGVTDLKYSPDGRLLAAATADTWIDIYNAAKGYQRISRCSGHRCIALARVCVL